MSLKLFSILSRLILATALIAAFQAVAEEESILLNPQTGNYHIRYKSIYDGNLLEVIFVPATKIVPVVKSKFEMTKTGAFGYRYKIRNSSKSEQSIAGFDLVVSGVNASDQKTPNGWKGVLVPADNLEGKFRAGWFYSSKGDITAGLKPGANQSGFYIESTDLPGIDVAKMDGAAPTLELLDGGPNPKSTVGDELEGLRANNFIPRPAAVPLIPVPNPFDAAAVLTSVQKHVNQDMVSMNLIDPTFASQLDRLFQTAIAAAKGGNTVALKGNLKDLRHLLKREHADVDKEDEDWDKDNDGKDKEKDKSRQIDKLAAKVLDFDLKYIQKRLGNDD